MIRPYFIDEEEDDVHFLDDPLMVVNAKPDFEGLGIPPIKEPKVIPQ